MFSGQFFYQKSINQQYALNISGGSEKTFHTFSAGWDKNRSNLTRDEKQRITLNLYHHFSPIKNLEFSIRVNYTQLELANNNTVSDVTTGSKYSPNIYPYAKYADESGNALPIVKDYRAIYADTVGSNKFLNWRYYPLRELVYGENKIKQYDIRAATSLKYTLVKGLSIELNYQYQTGTNEGRSFHSQESYYTRNLINKFTVIKPDGSVKYNIPLGGILELSNSRFSSNRLRGQLNYFSTFNKHNINANRIFVSAITSCRTSIYVNKNLDSTK